MAAAIGTCTKQRGCAAAGVAEIWHVHRQEHRITIFIVVIDDAKGFAAMLRKRIAPAGGIGFVVSVRVVVRESSDARTERQTRDEFPDGGSRVTCAGRDGVIKDCVVRIGERKRTSADLNDIRAHKGGYIERRTGGAIKPPAAGVAIEWNQIASCHDDE